MCTSNPRQTTFRYLFFNGISSVSLIFFSIFAFIFLVATSRGPKQYLCIVSRSEALCCCSFGPLQHLELVACEPNLVVVSPIAAATEVFLSKSLQNLAMHFLSFWTQKFWVMVMLGSYSSTGCITYIFTIPKIQQ